MITNSEVTFGDYSTILVSATFLLINLFAITFAESKCPRGSSSIKTNPVKKANQIFMDDFLLRPYENKYEMTQKCYPVV